MVPYMLTRHRHVLKLMVALEIGSARIIIMLFLRYEHILKMYFCRLIDDAQPNNKTDRTAFGWNRFYTIAQMYFQITV